MRKASHLSSNPSELSHGDLGLNEFSWENSSFTRKASHGGMISNQIKESPTELSHGDLGIHEFPRDNSSFTRKASQA